MRRSSLPACLIYRACCKLLHIWVAEVVVFSFSYEDCCFFVLSLPYRLLHIRACLYLEGSLVRRLLSLLSLFLSCGS